MTFLILKNYNKTPRSTKGSPKGTVTRPQGNKRERPSFSTQLDKNTKDLISKDRDGLIINSFSEADNKCVGATKCTVVRDPWKEYKEIKEKDPDGERTLAILNYLMRHLEREDYKKTAYKIINDSFSKSEQLYYWYLGDYYSATKDFLNAKNTYEELLKKFKDREDEVPWGNVADFYFKIKDYSKALQYYENELRLYANRKESKTDFNREYVYYLERRIKKIEKILDK